MEPPKSPFVPLAVKVNQFQTQTPTRFKGKASKVSLFDFIALLIHKPLKTNKPVALTHPKSPYLVTKLRTKPVKYACIEWKYSYQIHF